MSHPDLLESGESWRLLADELGLEHEAGLRWVRRTPTELRFTVTRVGRATFGVTVRAPLSTPGVEASRWMTALPRSLALRAAEGHPTGDADFDAAVWLRLGEPRLVGLLDADTRVLLRKVVTRGVLLEDTELCLPAEAVYDHQPRVVEELVRDLERLSRRLRLDAQDLDERVLSLAVADPEAGVRERLAALVTSDARLHRMRANRQAQLDLASDETDPAALEALVQDRTVAPRARAGALVRLVEDAPFATAVSVLAGAGHLLGVLAGQERGASLEPVADALIAACRRNARDHARCVDALQLLWPYRPPGANELLVRLGELLAELRIRATLPLVKDLLGRDANDRVFEAGLIALGALGLPADTTLAQLNFAATNRAKRSLPGVVATRRAGGALLAMMFAQLHQDDTDFAQVALVALGALGDARFEGVALGALKDPRDGVELAAVEALGGMGTLAALDELEPLKGGLFRSRALKTAAEQAITRIRERHGMVARPGALSLADAQPGGLALSPDDEG